MADPPAPVTAQVFDPNPAQSQRVFGEHYPWIFTFTGEDVLEVTSWNSAAGVRLRISGRVHAAPGVIVPFSATHIPNTDRSAVTSVITMPLGELLNAIVYAETGSPQTGQTFVRVAVRRGAGGAFDRLGVLIQGTVTANSARAFPGSVVQSPVDVEPFVRTITGTAPAAGLNFGESCPAGARWEVLRVMNQLTTSGAAANRYPQFRAVQNGVRTVTVDPAGAAAAVSSWDYMWAPNLTPIAALTGTVYQQPFPDRLLFVGGDFFFSSTVNLQAGDQWAQPMFVVREWLDV